MSGSRSSHHLGDLLIEPRGDAGRYRDHPIGFVDLAGWPDAAGTIDLPPFPLIGVGDPLHPVAPRLDAVIEPPITVAQIVANVDSHPHAAALAAQLLRNMEGMETQRALVFESLAYAVLQGSAEHAAWLETRGGKEFGEPGQIGVHRSGETLHLVLDRASALNAIDRPMRDRLFEAFTVAALDPDVRRIELTAAGRAFSIGGDLAEFGTTRDPATAHVIRGQSLPALPLSRCGAKLDVHVRGACIGAGLEMAAFARRITATPNAWFQLPELAMGLIPGAGGCVSIPRRIGRQRTALMILSGRRIGAATALAWGLIDAIEDRPSRDPGAAHAHRV